MKYKTADILCKTEVTGCSVALQYLCVLLRRSRLWDHLQDIEIVEDGAKHTLVLYNCKVPQTGEVEFTAANAKCSANLKVKGERLIPLLLSRFGSKLLKVLMDFKFLLWNFT